MKSSSLRSLLLLAFLGCAVHRSPTVFGQEGPRGLLIDSLRYSASAELFGPTPEETQTYMYTVTIENLGSSPVSPPFLPCAPWLTLTHPPESAASVRPVAAQDTATCPREVWDVRLEPGAVHRIQDGGGESVFLLADSVPLGEYATVVHLRSEGHAMELPGGKITITDGLEDIEVDVLTRFEGFAPQVLVTEAIVRNVGADTVHVDYGACALHAFVYGDLAESRLLLWDSMIAPNGEPYGCDLYGVSARIPPGDTLRAPEFRTRAPVYEILHDTLPAGRYEVSATMYLNYRSRELLPREIALQPEHVPLPSERTEDGLRYTVSTMASDSVPPLVRIETTVTNVTGETRTIGPFGWCPLGLWAYREPAARDRAWKNAPTFWSASFGCDLHERAFTIEPGESVTLPFDFVSAEIPSGRTYFALWVPDLEPADEVWRSILLAAGSVDFPVIPTD